MESQTLGRVRRRPGEAWDNSYDDGALNKFEYMPTQSGPWRDGLSIPFPHLWGRACKYHVRERPRVLHDDTSVTGRLETSSMPGTRMRHHIGRGMQGLLLRQRGGADLLTRPVILASKKPESKVRSGADPTFRGARKRNSTTPRFGRCGATQAKFSPLFSELARHQPHSE